MDDPMKRPREERSRSDQTAEQANEWLERFKNSQPGDRAAFVRWLKESRANVREILLASAWDVMLKGIDRGRRIDARRLAASASANVIEAREGSAVEPPPARRFIGRHLARIGMGAAAALVLGFGAVWWIRAGLPEQYATTVGEQRTVELTDGSVVSLNTQSAIRVKFSEGRRDLYLSEGQAIFAVVHDAARPFRVHVGSAVVQAIGTKFDIRRVGGRIQVAVIEGKVQVTPEAISEALESRLETVSQVTRLTAGQATEITTSGIAPPTAVDIAEVTAWQQRRLKVMYSTLEDVVEEFNRFNRTPQIRIQGEKLRALPISGVFEVDDPESLIASLVSDRSILVERGGDELIIRPRPLVVQSEESTLQNEPARSDEPSIAQ